MCFVELTKGSLAEVVLYTKIWLYVSYQQLPSVAKEKFWYMDSNPEIFRMENQHSAN